MANRDAAGDQHPTPELAVSDSYVNSPSALERTITAFTPPEPANSGSALQVDFETAPVINYNSSPPKAIPNADTLKEESTGKDRPSDTKICGCSRKVFWVSIALSVLVIAAITVGVEIKAKVSGVSPSPPPPLPTEHSILNGTSIAAISLTTKDRYLFFQDHTGDVRQAARTASKAQWATTSYIVTSDARKYTPLAVVPANSPNSSETMYLFYIAANHTVASVAFVNGAWISAGIELSGAISTPSSSYLSASRMFGSLPRYAISNGLSNGPSEELCLLYENAKGNVTLLIGKVVHVDSNRNTEWTWEWDDISDKLYSSLTDAQFGPPFQSRTGWDHTTVNSSFINLIGRDTTAMTNQMGASVRGRFLTSVYTPQNKTFSTNIYPNSFNKAIEQSDIAFMDGPLGFVLWVDDNRLAFLYTGKIASIPLLDSSFPYARLATTSDSSILYLYHQLNGSTFVEDQWNASSSGWAESTNINIWDA